MKGVLFNLLEEVVTDAHGMGVWDDVLDDLELDGAYTAAARYEDEEFLSIIRALPAGGCPVGAAAVRASDGPGPQPASGPDADLLRWYGRSALPLLAATYPMFFSPHADALDLLATVEDVIHVEVRKLDPTARVPTFGVHEEQLDGRRALVLDYRSPRRLCALAEGFSLGAGDHYGQPLRVSQRACMHRGDPTCELVAVHA